MASSCNAWEHQRVALFAIWKRVLHFSYFTACHTTIDIGLVGEDEQACTHESLSDAVSVVVRPANEGKNAHFL